MGSRNVYPNGHPFYFSGPSLTTWTFRSCPLFFLTCFAFPPSAKISISPIPRLHKFFRNPTLTPVYSYIISTNHRNPICHNPTKTTNDMYRDNIGVAVPSDSRKVPHNTDHTLHIVLVEPRIGGNTATSGRTALGFTLSDPPLHCRLHVVHPLGFAMDAAQVRRAGLDYWSNVDLIEWKHGWSEFLDAIRPDTRSPCSESNSSDFHYFVLEPYFSHPIYQVDLWSILSRDEKHPPKLASDLYLIFGNETSEYSSDYETCFLPSVLAHRRINIPQSSTLIRSLNLSNAVAIAGYEAVRQYLSLKNIT